MNFLNTVSYQPDLVDNGYLSKFESAANVCLAPSHWLVRDIYGKPLKFTLEVNLEFKTVMPTAVSDKSEGFRKVIRIITGLLLAIPGLLFAIPLKGIAYTSEEIRLKHRMCVLTINPEEQKTLVELIEKRQQLKNERQGCNPIVSPSLLCTICCLLCCLVCKK